MPILGIRRMPRLKRDHDRFCLCHSYRLTVGKDDLSLLLPSNDSESPILNRHIPWEGIPIFQSDTRARENLHSQDAQEQVNGGQSAKRVAFSHTDPGFCVITCMKGAVLLKVLH